MRKALLKIMSCIMSVIVTAAVLPITFLSAADNYVILYDESDSAECSSCVEFEGELITDEELEKITEAVRKDYADCTEVTNRKLSAYDHSSDYFYNQLDADGKAFFDALEAACDKFAASNVNLSTEIMCEPIKYNSSTISLDEAINIYRAFYFSNPQYFFIRRGYTYSYSGTFTPKVEPFFMSSDVREEYAEKISSITISWMKEINNCSTSIEKELLIAEKMCEAISYESSDIDQSIAAALVDKKCVCNGYTMTFTYFCNAAGIDCVGIKGNNHTWNIININGTWYQTDITWMDQGGYIWFDYYNKSEATFVANDDSRKNHTIDNTYYDVLFTLPECTVDAPSIPESVQSSHADNTITLSWVSDVNATHYRIYRSESISGVKKHIATTKNINYTDSDIVFGKRYYYFISSYNNETKYESPVSSCVYGGIPIVSGDFKYFYLNNTDIEVAEYSHNEANLEIPASIDGYKVTSISGSPGYFHYYPETVTIPDTVTSIGDYAFYGCYNINSITIPNGVTFIGTYVFYGCDFTEIVIPASVKAVDDYAFYLCDTLTDVYYKGSESKWNSISIGEYNEDLLNATIHYNYKTAEEIAQINNFVERLYVNLLGRSSDAKGKANHVNSLKSGKTAAQVGASFVNSAELKNKKLTNREFVKRMYQTFLDRTPSSAEITRWATTLDNGCSYAYILKSFVASAEFKKLAASYGITAGTYAVTEYRDYNEKLTAYVSRMYTKALGRNYDITGLNNNTGRYIKGEKTAAGIAEYFILSKEFKNKNLTNEQFVTTLYNALFDRAPDAGGKSRWLTKMKNGTTREEVLKGFTNAAEFKNLVKSFGL